MTRLSRRTLSAVLVATLVVLAGCSGLGQSDSSTETPGDTQTMDETLTAEVDETNGTETNRSSLDQQLLDDHTIALLQTGSYTVNVTTSGNGTATTTAAEVNLTAQSKHERLTTITDGGTISVDTYRPPGSDTVYTQTGSGENAFYASESATGNFTASEIGQPYLITDVTYQQFGTETVDGTTVQRYVANDISSLNVSSDGWGGQVVTNISSVVLVDADRNIVYGIDADYAVQTSEGNVVTYSYEVTYSDVGSTSVTEPDWLDEAR